MKRGFPILLAFALVAALVGCKKDADAPASKPDTGAQASTSDASFATSDTSSEFMLVNLKVPNMT